LILIYYYYQMSGVLFRDDGIMIPFKNITKQSIYHYMHKPIIKKIPDYLIKDFTLEHYIEKDAYKQLLTELANKPTYLYFIYESKPNIIQNAIGREILMVMAGGDIGDWTGNLFLTEIDPFIIKN